MPGRHNVHVDNPVHIMYVQTINLQPKVRHGNDRGSDYLYLLPCRRQTPVPHFNPSPTLQVRGELYRELIPTHETFQK